MSIKTATAPQRQDLRDKLSIATTGAHKIAQNVHAPLSDAEAAPIQLACEAATAALAAVGIGAGILPATQKVVTTGDRINIRDKDANPTTTTAELTVTAGVVSGILIASGVALVPTAVKQSVGTVTGTGTFGTFTIVNGAITGIVLSAS